MKQNRALPDWCGILDGLISEDNKDGVDVVSEAPPTPATLNTRHSPKMEALNNG